MITSKLTAKARTTIPQAVRVALHLKEGDEIAYSIEQDRAILTKARWGVIGDPFTIFSEWDSEQIGKLTANFEKRPFHLGNERSAVVASR